MRRNATGSGKTNEEYTRPITMRSESGSRNIKATITKLTWERVNLLVGLCLEGAEGLPEAPDLYLVTAEGRANAHLKLKEQDSGRFTYCLNITNPGYRACLPVGTYRFMLASGNTVIADVMLADDTADSLAEASRSFLYGKKKSAYIVDFSVAETGQRLVVRVLNAHQSELKPPGSTVNRSHKRHKLISKKDVKQLIQRYYLHMCKEYDRNYDGRPRAILFLTEQSETLGENLQSVHRRMMERGLDEQYELMTSARSAVTKHYGQKSWRELMSKVAKADLIFVDDHCPFLDWLMLCKRTTLVQLWHAGAGFKASGYSRWGRTGCPGPYSGHRQYDYGITSSTRISHYYSEVFGINPEQLLPVGMPRMDEYLSPEHRKRATAELMGRYPVKGKRVVLFAPTYRGKNKGDAHYPYDRIDFRKLAAACGEDAIILFKMHPWVKDPVPIPRDLQNRMIDVSSYRNINDLFYITDLLITDYSSNIFEFSLMKKPMLFYAFDEKEYAYARGFHRPYEESAPGRCCRTFRELIEAIEKKDFRLNKVNDYVRLHYDFIDTGSSDRAIDWFVTDGIPEQYARRIKAVEMDNERLRLLDFSEVLTEGEEKPGVDF